NTLSITSSNRRWILSARALTPNFIFVPSLGDPNPNKPASDLAIRARNEANVWIPLSTSNQVVGGGAKKTTESEPIDYQLTSNLNTDPPGIYSMSIIFTVVEN